MAMGFLNPERAGKKLINGIKTWAGYFGLTRHAFLNIRMLRLQPVRAVFLKQVYFTGIEAFGMVSVLAVLIGFVIIAEVANLAGASSDLMGKILVWTVVRELGPLFTAIIIIARSGTAIASELGSMKVGGEVDSLRVAGINPMDYLIVPRILGMIASVFVLTFYFIIMASVGGLLLSSAVFVDIPFLRHVKGMLATLSILESVVFIVKSLVFGTIIASVVCQQGLSVKSSITEIPQAATRAVMQSLFLVVIFDGIITSVTLI